MDEELLRLRRAATENPTDEAAARAYDAALRRAGKTEEVYDRFRFKFECPKKWEELERTADNGKRHCKECDKTVHFARNEAEFHEHALAGHCVAFSAPLEVAPLVRDERIHTAADDRSPCLVPHRDARWPTKEEWAALERSRAAALAAPEDANAARAYEGRLLALGDYATLRKRITKKYLCGRCERCRTAPRQEIEDAAEAARRLAAGECVATSQPDAILVAGVSAGKLHGARETTHGCMILVAPRPRPVVTLGVPRRPDPPPPAPPPRGPGLWKRIFG